MTDGDRYFLRFRGQVTGPFTRDELLSMAGTGQVSTIHSVSQDKHNWVSAKSLTWLFPPVIVTPPRRAEPPSAPSIPPAVEAEQSQAPSAPAFAPAGSRPQAKRLSWITPVAVFVAVFAVATPAAVYYWMRRPPAVTSAINGEMLSRGLGLVVSGAELVGYDGTLREKPQGTGTAFAVSRDGLMLTNKHVVESYIRLSRAGELKEDIRKKTKISIQERLWVFVNGQKHPATIVHVSEKYDLAVLKVPIRFDSVFRLRAADSAVLDSDVRAAGFPQAGNVQLSLSKAEELEMAMKQQLESSDVSRVFSERDFDFVLTSGRISRSTHDRADGIFWLQHNADINPGNSGGPLLTMDGTVIGINTLGGGGQGMSGMFFSLPLKQLRGEISMHVKDAAWTE